LALAGSLTTGSPVAGMAYMALFGAGTVPLMLATSVFGRLLLRPSLQAFARRALPAGMFALGALFVLRGLGLGIAYVSPILHAAGGGHGH
ncbi:MAG: sulfite exporter TauE/SafE family protein, partial [bacterium]|nr:sulfite exporter TauE/SafE family protein [bacterium]